MQLIELLSSNSSYFAVTAALFGLFIGSFLNVVIYRLPIMLERSWKKDCSELLEQELAEDAAVAKFNLLVPRSRCPQCKTMIRSVENIPVFSYLLQKGKCRHCQASIPLQYPLVELTTAFLTGLVAYKFGFGWLAFSAIYIASPAMRLASPVT